MQWEGSADYLLDDVWRKESQVHYTSNAIRLNACLRCDLDKGLAGFYSVVPFHGFDDIADQWQVDFWRGVAEHEFGFDAYAAKLEGRVFDEGIGVRRSVGTVAITRVFLCLWNQFFKRLIEV